LFGGHLGGAAIGIACYQALGEAPWVYALAQALALAFMLILEWMGRRSEFVAFATLDSAAGTKSPPDRRARLFGVDESAERGEKPRPYGTTSAVSVRRRGRYGQVLLQSLSTLALAGNRRQLFVFDNITETLHSAASRFYPLRER
jgi:hypothetical protein